MVSSTSGNNTKPEYSATNLSFFPAMNSRLYWVKALENLMHLLAKSGKNLGATLSIN